MNSACLVHFLTTINVTFLSTYTRDRESGYACVCIDSTSNNYLNRQFASNCFVLRVKNRNITQEEPNFTAANLTCFVVLNANFLERKQELFLFRKMLTILNLDSLCSNCFMIPAVLEALKNRLVQLLMSSN